VFAYYVPRTCIVKAFDHLPAGLLAEDPRTASGRRVLFVAGSDASAKA
jgi:8-hydroxy-5-deazaflavin:NADPH oxidoreductase